jgi:glucose-6-phosphate isomerase
MAMRMRETMYVAELLNLNAFDQPNVEDYKKKTKAILGL